MNLRLSAATLIGSAVLVGGLFWQGSVPKSHLLTPMGFTPYRHGACALRHGAYPDKSGWGWLQAFEPEQGNHTIQPS